MSIGIVQTQNGKVRGEELTGKYEGLTFFKGIPYAKPPVGELRFRAPEKPESWEGVKECTAFAPMAIQKFPENDDFVPYGLDFYYMGYPEASEDCLYVNVCTPAQSADEKRPVYIWFHGGGLSTGFTSEVEFSPEELTRKGIVVVQVAQRLNVFGYLCLPQLSEEAGHMSGNYGFLDQLMALDWVVDNIQAFGGDPDNITIGGQSGGTTKCATLVANPRTQGKIKRVILESGLKWKMKLDTPEDMYRISREYLKEIGLDPDISPGELRKIDPWKLYTNQTRAHWSMVWDGDLLPKATIEELFDAYLGDVDMLIGANFGEGAPEANKEMAAKMPFTNKEDFYQNYRLFIGDELYEKYDFEKLFPVTDESCWRKAKYLSGQGLSINDRPGGSRNVMLDRVFAKLRFEKYPDKKVFIYYLTHILPGRDEDKGTPRDTENLLAYHSSELWYTFGSLRENVPPVRPWREEDYQLADMATTYWSNFMRTGDVNGEGVPAWPAADDQYRWIELEVNPKVHEGFDLPEDPLLREYVRKEFGA